MGDFAKLLSYDALLEDVQTTYHSSLGFTHHGRFFPALLQHVFAVTLRLMLVDCIAEIQDLHTFQDGRYSGIEWSFA